MRDKIKRVVCFLLVLLVFAANLPATASAVDPVSTATIANAFAQAITAYGASNGVSMIFDDISSSETSQIGERMHDLWKKFRDGQQTADDYETIAAAIWPGLYSKVINAAGNAVVAINIADTYMPDIDEFWNWVLSGPAEMQKVDNAYQWNVVNGSINPVVVYSYNPINLSYLPNAPAANIQGDYSTFSNSLYVGTSLHLFCRTSSSSYVFYIPNPDFPDKLSLFACSPLANQVVSGIYSSNYWMGIDYSLLNSYVSNGITVYYRGYIASVPVSNRVSTIPLYNDYQSGIVDILSGAFDEDLLSVQPYVGDAVAKPVPIPDTSDPDYGPLPYIGNLPIPWNDTLFGDGTGTLTDAQSDAITDAIDDAIVANPDKTIEMENATTDDPDKPTTDDPPSNDPDDYAVPGLQNIFPFCIPFDVYNFLSALAAEPTAPHFTATLQFPAVIGGPQTIDIDFNNQTFNTLAGILRTLELLAFIVGLALLTRSMFIRG